MVIKRVAISANYTKFIPFIGGEPTTQLTSNSDIHISKQVSAGAKVVFVAEGAKPKKKTTRNSAIGSASSPTDNLSATGERSGSTAAAATLRARSVVA